MSFGLSKKSNEPKPSTSKVQIPPTPKPSIPSSDANKPPTLEPMSNTNSQSFLPKDAPPPPLQKSIDNAKNIEIRRMSATDDGDKVLESAWDSSPEKETNKTPLQMVQSIVSQIEDVKPPAPSAAPPKIETSQPPAWVQGSQRPLLHSQKQVANETPPSSKPLPNLIPPQQRTTIVSTTQQNLTTIMAPTPQFVHAAPPAGGQQVMQLVNTINGPMLMQTIPAPSIAVPQDPKQIMNKNIKKPDQQPVNAAGPIQYQTQVVPAVSGGPMPILMSPTSMVTGQQASPTGVPQPQHVLIGHPTAGMGMIQGTPQFVLNQPTMIAPTNQVFLSSNGTLVAMPTAPPQGVIYNQLPDGTLVQVQSPVIQQAPQTIFTTNGSLVINSGAAQQVSPTGGQIQFQTAPAPTGGTYIMTPSGLVQASPAVSVANPTPINNISPSTIPVSTSSVTELEPQPGPSSIRKESTDKSEDSDDDDDEDDSDHDGNESMGDVQLVLQMDEDSSEDEIPLAKKKLSPSSSTGHPISSSSKGFKTKNTSPKTYIQSNKVDSSGLQATPPHPADESESPMNKLSSPERVTTSTKDEGLDTSGSTDASSPSKSPTKRRRKRNAEELLKEGIEHDANDSDGKYRILSNYFIEIFDHMPIFTDSDDGEKNPKSTKQFSVGELVWGPHGTFPSWPGKLVRFERDGSKVLVCWFGNRDTSQVNPHYLKSLSDGLEAHHRERKKLRK